ncbi:S-layer homology domain-containing protein [Symbiobacterium thermophilum]
MTDGAAQIAGRWFADAAQWQMPRHVAEAVRAGWIAGYPEPDGRYSFRPDRTATRAEAAALLVRAVGEALGRAE